MALCSDLKKKKKSETVVSKDQVDVVLKVL